MYKLAAIIGGFLLMAGVALAGTMTSLDSTNSPTIGTTVPPLVQTSTQHEDRGAENELRGRQNEPGEDLRGPCDEAEHANDARCTGAATGADDSSGPSDSSVRGSNSGHGSDDGGNSGHGGGGDDD
jgi:hypothetical protein